MGMNVGTGGSSNEPEVMMDINTTPLIDVMLVLLIMLIITIPIQLHSVQLNMPVGAPPPTQVEPEKVRIDIDAQSQVFWNAELVDRDALQSKMLAAAAQPTQPVIIIRPDKAAKYEVVAKVLASTQRANLTRMTVAGAEQFIE
ncbi:MAG: ExbD/TolR family protein [Burkholderiaceae bacterium]